MNRRPTEKWYVRRLEQMLAHEERVRYKACLCPGQRGYEVVQFNTANCGLTDGLWCYTCREFMDVVDVEGTNVCPCFHYADAFHEARKRIADYRKNGKAETK